MVSARVLIVDDHLGTLETFSLVLRNAGFETATAATGQEGIAIAKRRRFDVVLVDLRLPDMSGVEVVRELRLDRASNRLVVVTAFPALDTSFAAAVAGADGYVGGPLWGTDVVDVVVQALNGPLPVRGPASRPATSGDAEVSQGKAFVDRRVREVIRIIEIELEKPWSVADLAARVGLSESALNHLFHAHIGTSITAHRIGRRLQVAAQQLRTTHDRIHQIAYRVGFRSLSLRDFRRAFRDRFGLSPKSYRAKFWCGPPDPM